MENQEFESMTLCPLDGRYSGIKDALGEYFSDRFTNLGYIGICDGVYMSDKGIIQNIWENKDVREFWISMVQLKREGLLSCDKNEDYSEALSGNFMAMIATMPKEIMDGNYLYLEDEEKFLSIHASYHPDI